MRDARPSVGLVSDAAITHPMAFSPLVMLETFKSSFPSVPVGSFAPAMTPPGSVAKSPFTGGTYPNLPDPGYLTGGFILCSEKWKPFSK